MCEWPDEKQRFGNHVFNVRPVGGNLLGSQNGRGPSLLHYFFLLLLLYFFLLLLLHLLCLCLCLSALKMLSYSPLTETENNPQFQVISRLEWYPLVHTCPQFPLAGFQLLSVTWSLQMLKGKFQK